MSESPKVKEEKFDFEGFEKLKSAFAEYEAEQKGAFQKLQCRPAEKYERFLRRQM